MTTPPPPEPPRPPGSGGTVAGLAVVGAFLYFAINLAAGLLVLSIAADSRNSGGVIATGAVLLALIAFGGGGALLAVRRPWAKGLGLGLMIGWALTSVLTAGICTGLSPTIYRGL